MDHPNIKKIGHFIVKPLQATFHALLIAAAGALGQWMVTLRSEDLEAMGVPPELVPIAFALITFTAARINSMHNEQRLQRLAQAARIKEANDRELNGNRLL